MYTGMHVHCCSYYCTFLFSICDLHIGSDEGLGFHIKGHSPVVIYATDPGLPAARAGVVPGSCILEVWLGVCWSINDMYL